MNSLKENGKTKSNKAKDSGKSKKNIVNISGITHDKIREKANEIYLQRIGHGDSGTAENDWIEAEKFLREAES